MQELDNIPMFAKRLRVFLESDPDILKRFDRFKPTIDQGIKTHVRADLQRQMLIYKNELR